MNALRSQLNYESVFKIVTWLTTSMGCFHSRRELLSEVLYGEAPPFVSFSLKNGTPSTYVLSKNKSFKQDVLSFSCYHLIN